MMIETPAHSTVFVAVDEGGNIGSQADGSWYALCGCTVSDRKRFADATRRFHFGREMKFKKDGIHRFDVLDYAIPAIDSIYYVAVKKTQERYSSFEQHIIHQNALARLSDMILYSDKSPHVDVEIDYNSMILDYVAESLFEDNRYARGRDVKVEIVSSANSYEMQTHDFIVGSIGRMLNRNDDSYYRELTVPIQSIMTTSDVEKNADSANRAHMVRADARRHEEIDTAVFKPSQEAR